MRNLHSIGEPSTPVGDWINTYFNSTGNANHIRADAIEGTFLTTDQIRHTQAMMRRMWWDQDQVENHRRDEDRFYARRVMLDLSQTAEELRLAGFRRFDRVSLHITQRELRSVWAELSPADYQRYFGPEGTRPTFMGIPLDVESDYHTDPLLRR